MFAPSSIVKVRLSFFVPAQAGRVVSSYWNCIRIVFPCVPPGRLASSPAPGAATAAFSTREPIPVGGPRRMNALPRSVSAPRFLPSGKRLSASATRASKRERKTFCWVVW